MSEDDRAAWLGSGVALLGSGLLAYLNFVAEERIKFIKSLENVDGDFSKTVKEGEAYYKFHGTVAQKGLPVDESEKSLVYVRDLVNSRYYSNSNNFGEYQYSKTDKKSSCWGITDKDQKSFIEISPSISLDTSDLQLRSETFSPALPRFLSVAGSLFLLKIPFAHVSRIYTLQEGQRLTLVGKVRKTEHQSDGWTDGVLLNSEPAWTDTKASPLIVTTHSLDERLYELECKANVWKKWSVILGVSSAVLAGLAIRNRINNRKN